MAAASPLGPAVAVLCALTVLHAMSVVLLCDAAAAATCVGVAPAKHRPEVISITDFGGVGDGRTLNTWAFRKAVYRIQHQRRRGGTTLHVPAGTWLTGSFNLTSHLTLYLEQGAVIVGVKVMPAVGWGALPCFGFRFLSRVVKAVVVTEILLALAFRVCAYPFQPALAGCELVGLVLLIW